MVRERGERESLIYIMKNVEEGRKEDRKTQTTGIF